MSANDAVGGARPTGARRSTQNRWSVRLPVAAALATILASICLGEVFQNGAWFLPTAFSVVFVVAGCELARRSSVPRVLVPVVGLAALVIYLVARYGRAEATFGVMPDPSAMQQLVDLAALGNKDMHRYAAPIAVTAGIELLTVAGVGLIALLVDSFAVTARRAALAGLPLLALYMVPAALAPDGVKWQAFALAGIGYLGLLLTEARERVTRWGRPMRYSSDAKWQDEIQTAPLAQLGRRVGAAALGIALVVPAVLPEISLGALGFGGSGFGRGNGVGNRVSVVNPIADLGRDLRQGENRTVIRYQGAPTYLRMVALDVFDGTTWEPSKLKVPDEQTLESGLPRPPGLSPSSERGRTRHEIQVLELEQQWLPLPYPATDVDIEGRWLYDMATFNVFSTNTSTRGKSYAVTSRTVAPTAERLRAAQRDTRPGALDPYLQYPLNMPPVVQRTAAEVTKAATTDYDKALAIQNWLRDPAEFTYSTEVSRAVGDSSGSAAIAAFLRARSGYCVHFASTMAIMARMLDIPARVAIGFTPGSRDRRDGNYTVGLHDAHSWPELYFEDTGWVAFEPTPAARTGEPPVWAQPADAATGSAEPTAAAGVPTSMAPSINPNRTGEDIEALSGADDAEKALWQRLRLPLVPTLLFLATLLLASLPALTRHVVRRRRWRNAVSPAEQVSAAWADLHDTLRDFGVSWHDSDSPRRGAARVAVTAPLTRHAAGAISRIAGATERLRYATDLGDVGDLRADVAAVHASLAAGSSRRRRARARLLPRSTRSVASAIAERLADVLDAVDEATATAKAKLTPPPLRRTG